LAVRQTADGRKSRTGTFLGVPYDWRWPTRERLKAGVWNPDDRRIFVPKVYGWGYGVNLREIARRARLVR
jgi:Family of unknown function (DUF5808)